MHTRAEKTTVGDSVKSTFVRCLLTNLVSKVVVLLVERVIFIVVKAKCSHDFFRAHVLSQRNTVLHDAGEHVTMGNDGFTTDF